MSSGARAPAYSWSSSTVRYVLFAAPVSPTSPTTTVGRSRYSGGNRCPLGQTAVSRRASPIAARCWAEGPSPGESGTRNGSVNRRQALGRGGGATRWPAEFCQAGRVNRSRQRGQTNSLLMAGALADQQREEDHGR